MFRTRPAALVGLLVALAVPVAACGSDDDSAFKEDYNKAVTPLSELSSEFRSSIGTSGGSGQQVAQDFERLADKAQQTRENLAQLDPPERAQDQFDELVSTLGQATEDLRAVAAAAEDGDAETRREAAGDLQESGTEIQKAETALQRAVDG